MSTSVMDYNNVFSFLSYYQPQGVKPKVKLNYSLISVSQNFPFHITLTTFEMNKYFIRYIQEYKSHLRV